MNSIKMNLLGKILSQPTAPFREGRVIDVIQEELNKKGVPHFLDPIGNLILGAASQNHYLQLLKKKSSEPARIYIAHMDHPGFHGVKWKSKTELSVRWYGGSPTRHLDGARVWLTSQEGWNGSGTLKNPKLLPSGKALESATVRLDSRQKTEINQTDAKSIYGGFRFRSPYWRKGDLLYTKAADDLIGCFSIVSMAIDISDKMRKKRVSSPPFLGILTRGEEVGFIGALRHFELGWLEQASRPIVCISLETSRTLPGAEIGQGPVVRLGDRFTVFDPGYTKVLTDLAQTVLPGNHQRRVMDGGTCEATAATVYGYSSIGISVPLGNYHNQSFEGGPDAAPFNGPAPEFVNINDVSALLKLCHALLKKDLPWTAPWKNKKIEFKRSIQKFLPLMRT